MVVVATRVLEDTAGGGACGTQRVVRWPTHWDGLEEQNATVFDRKAVVVTSIDESFSPTPTLWRGASFP